MYPGNGTVMRVCKSGVNTSSARVICSMAGYRLVKRSDIPLLRTE